jgi:hypothetical protein
MRDHNENRLKEELTDLIVRAKEADEDELSDLREELLDKLEIVGARTFVEITAESLEEEFEIEGCNDLKVPLKRIFTIPLPELKGKLTENDLSISTNHPIHPLIEEHKGDLETIQSINESISTGDEKTLRKIKKYYKDVDYHILKEEESLFPRLEERGMSEHPDNLREEHEEFRDSLIRFVKLIQTGNPEKYGQMNEEFENDFVPAMANHMFRENFIFYPAAVEFIPDSEVWDEIKKEFEAIDRLGN